MTTAKDMIAMLREHYIAPSKPASGYFCPELTAPVGNRRADLIWLPLTHVQRGEIVGHEVKVSRADVIQELADPTKADAWGRYCTQWWLVISDPALIDGLTIPDQWGVLAPPSGRRKRTMTVIKPAPKLNPIDQAEALATILARMFYAGDDAAARLKFLETQLEYAQQRQQSAEDQNRRAQAELRSINVAPRDADKIKAVLDAIRTLSFGKDGKDRYKWLDVDPQTIALAAADLTVVRKCTQNLANHLRRRIDLFEQALDKLQVGAITEGLRAIERDIEAELAAPVLEGLEVTA